jgi:formate-dependent nitrite reductase membrane component NrfD
LIPIVAILAGISLGIGLVFLLKNMIGNSLPRA